MSFSPKKKKKTLGSAHARGLRHPPPVGPPSKHILITNRSGRFRLRAKRILVTWSQLPEDFDFDGLKELLETTLGPTKCSRAGREEHPETGGYHVHWFAEAKSDFIVNDPRLLDYCDVHPNIEPVRSTPWFAAEYPLKDGDVLWDEGTPPEKKDNTITGKWKAVMEASTKEEFLEKMREHHPDKLVCNFNSVMSYANHRYREAADEYVSPGMTCHCDQHPGLTQWVQRELRKESEGRRKSLIVYGPTRLGKTLWARSLGKHAYFPGMFMLEGFSEKVEFALFDDIMGGFKEIQNFKYWFGCQQEFVTTDKYMKKQKIRWGKPSIYLANKNPVHTLDEEDRKWVEGNCRIINVEHYLAHANDKEDGPIIEEHLPCQFCN